MRPLTAPKMHIFMTRKMVDKWLCMWRWKFRPIFALESLKAFSDAWTRAPCLCFACTKQQQWFLPPLALSKDDGCKPLILTPTRDLWTLVDKWTPNIFCGKTNHFQTLIDLHVSCFSRRRLETSFERVEIIGKKVRKEDFLYYETWLEIVGRDSSPNPWNSLQNHLTKGEKIDLIMAKKLTIVTILI